MTTIYPSIAARRRVLYCCTVCGEPLLQGAVAKVLMREGRRWRVVDLLHRVADRWCGTVAFAPNYPAGVTPKGGAPCASR